MDNDFLSLIYWAVWLASFLASKALGFFATIAELIPDEIKNYSIKYLPPLSETIPALILTILCAILSAIVRKLVDVIWVKYIAK
jgi:hypothetical protein